MPMTKQERDALKAFAARATAPYLYDDDDDSDVIELSPAQLRELLDGAERLEEVAKWVRTWCGSTAAERDLTAIIERGHKVVAGPIRAGAPTVLPQGEPEG